MKLKIKLRSYDEYKICIGDLAENEVIGSMDSFIQHGNVTCLQHSIYVSYISYFICRRLGLDYCSAARGGLLHDFFLYDWHIRNSHKGLHGFTHPYTALENANKAITINNINLGYFNVGMINTVSQEMQEKIKTKIALNEFGDPENIFKTIQYIRETSYLTGSCIDLNGGIV